MTTQNSTMRTTGTANGSSMRGDFCQLTRLLHKKKSNEGNGSMMLSRLSAISSHSWRSTSRVRRRQMPSLRKLNQKGINALQQFLSEIVSDATKAAPVA